MQLLETSLLGKHPDQGRCEDAPAVTADFVAVVDGATDKAGLLYDLDGTPVTSGRFAAQVVSAALAALPAEVTAPAAVAVLSAALTAALRAQRPTLAPNQLPSCSLVVVSRHRRELWRVGDCQARIGDRVLRAGKRVDDVAIAFRAAVLTTHLLAGASIAELRANDPGRRAILPLLERQGWLAQTTGEFGYAVLDGRAVPASGLLVDALPPGEVEVVLASDGYPELRGDLAQTEARLAELLAADPLCIAGLAGTKGVPPGACSFDDRSWVRLRL